MNKQTMVVTLLTSQTVMKPRVRRTIIIKQMKTKVIARIKIMNSKMKSKMAIIATVPIKIIIQTHLKTITVLKMKLKINRIIKIKLAKMKKVIIVIILRHQMIPHKARTALMVIRHRIQRVKIIRAMNKIRRQTMTKIQTQIKPIQSTMISQKIIKQIRIKMEQIRQMMIMIMV